MGRDLEPKGVLEMEPTLYFDPSEKKFHAHVPTISIAGLSHFSCISLMSTLEQQRE